MRPNRFLILGVTASGKGRIAFELAESLGAEIVSIDSMKVYRRMDIGTAKPPIEARRRIMYHLIDVVEPCESFSVGTFLELVCNAMEQITSRNKPVIAVGGTALYIKALLYGLFEGPAADLKIRAELQKRAETEGLSQLYQQLMAVDPVAAERINQNDAKRVIRALEVHKLTGKPISSFQKQWSSFQGAGVGGQGSENIIQDTDERRVTKEEYLALGFTWGSSSWKIIGLRREKAEESKRINLRVKRMIDDGLVDEVKALLAEEKPMSMQARSAIGYAEIIDYLSDRMSFDDAVERIKINTRRFAKHQRTWFKTFRNVTWLSIAADEPDEQVLAEMKAIVT